MTKPKTILCDVDGVCADLLTEWLRRYNQRWNDTLTPDDVTGWDLSRFVKPECGKRVFNILREPELYLNVPPIPGAKESVDFLRAMGYRVVFLTSCVRDSTDAKLRWLVDNGFLPSSERSPRDFIAAHDKALVHGDVLVDDAPHNLEDHPAPRKILFGAPHNNSYHDWSDVVRIILSHE